MRLGEGLGRSGEKTKRFVEARTGRVLTLDDGAQIDKEQLFLPTVWDD
jgi:hypothetical protein